MLNNYTTNSSPPPLQSVMAATVAGFAYCLTITPFNRNNVPDPHNPLYDNFIVIQFRLTEEQQLVGYEEVYSEELASFNLEWHELRILFPTQEFLSSFETCLVNCGLLSEEASRLSSRLLDSNKIDTFRSSAGMKLRLRRRHVFETRIKQIPASAESIEALVAESFKAAVDVEECVVCLEKMSPGVSIVILLPCSHIFHSECIVAWLRNSHVCPLCRFEMPINNPSPHAASLSTM